eukprot:6305578-Pyramimonas_sp.AAC.1
MDMKILPNDVPKLEYCNAVDSIGEALACIIRPEAVTSFARLSCPQACAALSSLIRAAGISSRVSGEAIYLHAAVDFPHSTWYKPIPTRTWQRKVGVGMSESDR